MQPAGEAAHLTRPLMKHRHGNRILGRVAVDRRALLTNLSAALLTHGSIVTSEAKAKELRKFLEPLITKARQEKTLHQRRQFLATFPTKVTVERLYRVAEAAEKRPGGYLRLTRLPLMRQDGGAQMRVDILDQVKE